MKKLTLCIISSIIFNVTINAETNVLVRDFQGKDNCFNIGISNINLNAGKANSVEKNKKKIYEAVKIFKKYGCNIVLFPEFSLTGYFWKNDDECWDYMRKGTINGNMDFIKKLKSMLDDNLQYIIFNNIRLDNKKPKGKFLNTTFLINKDFDTNNLYSQINEKNFLYDKNYLPGIENDFQKPSDGDRLTLNTEWGKFGFMTCYDLQHPKLIEEYSKNFKVDAIIGLACSPSGGIRNYPGMNVYTDKFWGKVWDILFPAYAFTYKAWFIACDAVGNQKKGNYNFWGGSGLWAPSGLKLIELSHSNSELLIIKNLNLKNAVKEEHEKR